MHRGEIEKLTGATNERGFTLVPTRIYFSGERSRAKVEIALARGKDLYDKRETIKKRDMARDVQRELREVQPVTAAVGRLGGVEGVGVSAVSRVSASRRWSGCRPCRGVEGVRPLGGVRRGEAFFVVGTENASLDRVRSRGRLRARCLEAVKAAGPGGVSLTDPARRRSSAPGVRR